MGEKELLQPDSGGRSREGEAGGQSREVGFPQWTEWPQTTPRLLMWQLCVALPFRGIRSTVRGAGLGGRWGQWLWMHSSELSVGHAVDTDVQLEAGHSSPELRRDRELGGGLQQWLDLWEGQPQRMGRKRGEKAERTQTQREETKKVTQCQRGGRRTIWTERWYPVLSQGMFAKYPLTSVALSIFLQRISHC